MTNQEIIGIVLKLIYDGKYPYPYGISSKSSEIILFSSLLLGGIFVPTKDVFFYLACDGRIISIDLTDKIRLEDDYND